ncbi:tryptophan synthase subunit beta [Candidatus Ornithobacterium hominis]|uniref:tryptophan synthase subunit beta n=1 Tax=Candidatus Ornithobacterium hominis TaxID=2497989 RepID=UPI0024BD0ED2|nr:tryptophan synthase subunit beta [Candidatus Ornithobacterium hominis]
MMKNPDELGYYGEFGGAFIPEMLYPNIQELQRNYQSILADEKFVCQYEDLLRNYVGRPSPLYFAQNLSEKKGAKIYLKREDLNHTGAHKINNAIGQVLMAKHLGKTRIIAETGAGQHGVATATACALLQLPCTVYMGEVDIERQNPNVQRMKMLGATVRPAQSGSKTLKDAVNEALQDWVQNAEDTFYVLGSAVGPHPYPDLVTRLQQIISKEAKNQYRSISGRDLPTRVIACLGGGSNAAGMFYHFIDEKSVELIGVEAAGLGINSGKSAATIQLGKIGVLHGSKSLLIQTEDGQVIEPHSISAGLDYPGIGPLHSYLATKGRLKVLGCTDDEALAAAYELTKVEGILPALESAHALAALNQLALKKEDEIIVCLSGRGDKDLATYIKNFEK